MSSPDPDATALAAARTLSRRIVVARCWAACIAAARLASVLIGQ